jgi:hypothetical protein
MTPIDRAAIAAIRHYEHVRVMAIATWFGIFGLVTLVGCAQTLSDATRYADKSMAIVDVAANEGARAYRDATLEAINVCRAELGDASTPEAREACLSRKGFAPDQIGQVREAFEALARAYDEIATALEEIREATPALEQAENAVEGLR